MEDYPSRQGDQSAGGGRFGLPNNFTANEIELLLNHREFYESLEFGTRQPESENQRHFIQVVEGNCPAESEHEKAYLKFREVGPSDRPPFKCTECEERLGTSFVLDNPGVGTCTACSAETQIEKTSSKPVRSDLFGFSYGGKQKVSGVKSSGGFVDYDYDHVSPHNIPRKGKRRRKGDD